MKRYVITFVHPIAGRCPDATTEVEILDPDQVAAYASTDLLKRELGKELRRVRVLFTGQRVREVCREGADYIIFPTRTPGGWHSIRLAPKVAS